MAIIVLDFDHTLFNAQVFKKDLAKSLGLSLVKWEQQYQKNKIQYKNYNYKAQLKLFPEDKQKKFLKVLDNCKKYLYLDSKVLIKKINNNKIILLSKGNQSWQKIKIQNCGLDKKIKVKTTTGSKVNFVKQLAKKDIVIFINDRGKEIDEVKNKVPEVVAIWIKRSNGQYKNEQCKKFDYKSNNLKINIETYERKLS